jgi:hypothetical protein
MIKGIIKAMISFKSIGVAPIVILASIYRINATKAGSIIFIILFTFDGIFRLDHNII